MANMTAERFMEIKNRAKRIIDMDVNGQLDGIKKKAVSEGRLSYDNSGNAETTLMSEENVKQQRLQNEMTQMPSYSQSAIQNSKLPKEIVESMVNNPIDTTMLEVPGVTTSILDQLNYMSNGKILEQQAKPQAKKQQVIKEETTRPQGETTNVDYSMIKMIVEDCMKKYAGALKKTILSESKAPTNESTLQAMKIGNKFSFIDSKGNLYEANLKFIKNINE